MCPIFGEHRKLNILVVDDEKLVADSLVQILNLSGFNAHSLYSGSGAVERAKQEPYDVLITEVVLTGLSGIDAAIEVSIILPNCNVLLMSGDNQTDDMLKDTHARGHDFEILPKPVYPTVIIDRLKRYERRELNTKRQGH